MCRVQTDVLDRDVGVNGLKFPERDDGTDTVVSPGIEETDMQGQVNTEVSIVGAEHVKSMAEIEGIFITDSSPVGIRIGEMAFAGAVVDTVSGAFADFMLIRG